MCKKILKKFEEKYSSTSPIKELRKFVSKHSLQLKDRSKINLYNKIIKYLKNKSKQSTLMTFFRNKHSKRVKGDFYNVYETVYVKEEYIPFLKTEMIFEEESWNKLKELILFRVK